jgi:glutamyl-tRNA synthetase
MGEGNKKLSKRDPQSSLRLYRDQGYIPEGLLNYLALLGWSIADDRDIFTLDEMVAAFDIADVNANPARFDPKKCEAINATHLRMLRPADFAERLGAHLRAARLDVTGPQLAMIAPLVQERVQTLGQAVDMVRFLLVDDAEFRVDEAAAAKQLGPDGQKVLAAAIPPLDDLTTWTHDEINRALETALVDGLGLKPRHAYGPVRVAVTGSAVSPPLFESMEILGKGRTLDRLRAAQR